ncbi:MAG: hypothetical protein JWO70_1626 [Betaproteobacteria bacterium]|nr:hypothetical protein [Betaproteobacteria bacterium]
MRRVREKLLICVSSLQASAAHWRGGKIVQLEHFAHDERGLADFRQFLTPFSNVPVFMMVDAVEEDYRFETLPHSFGLDRAQMVSRKLRQHYRNTPYIGAWLQGRENDKRRDDRYLFAALTNPDIPADWLKIIAAQELPLGAVYLLPMISAALLDKLQVKAPNILLAAQHTGGLRLTFFRDRQFRLSRLTRGDSAKSTDPVRLFSGEISNTRLYLHALRTATLDEHLTVLLLDRNDELETVAETIARDNPSLDSVRIGRAELASRLGLDPQLLSNSADAIYLQLLGLQTPAGNIAPAPATQGYKRYRARRAIFAACASIAAISALWSGANAWQAYRVNSQAADVSAQISAQELQYQQITREFPPSPTSGDNLKRAVEVAKALRESARDPVPMMAAVSAALQPTPGLVLRELAWKYGATDVEKGGDNAAHPQAPARASTPGAPGAAPAARHQSAYLVGEIRPFRGDYRAAIDTIDGLAARLRLNPAVAEVRTRKMPLNVSPTAPLSGNTLDSARSAAATAEFEIVVVFKPRI